MRLLGPEDIYGDEIEPVPTPIKDDSHFFEHVTKVIGPNAVRAGTCVMHVGDPGHIEMLGFATNALRNLPLESSNTRTIFMQEHEGERIKAIANLLETQFVLLTNRQMW